MAAMKAPTTLTTARLILRRPRMDDAPGIFDRYASDPEVTRYLGWPRHHTVGETQTFLQFAEGEWRRWPAGPYLITSKDNGALLGGTGFTFEKADCASTGYVLAKDAWGLGYATEALRAVVELAPSLGLTRLYALCHPDHRASTRVLEKCGFRLEEKLLRHTVFPNLEPGIEAPTEADVLSFSLGFRQSGNP